MNIPVRTRLPVDINLAPLVDVIFILLIFVVLVAKFANEERLDVTLPSAAAGWPAEVDALMIEVTDKGVIVVEGQVVSLEDLHDVAVAKKRYYRRAVLLADSDTALQRAVDVISTVKLAGYDAVALATRPPDP
jgi:biopolymer transport protein ExbD